MDTAAPSALAILSPERIGVDNGPPWDDCAEQRYTRLCVWLIRLGVRVSHSRAYHPQTLGKDERFQETLNRELISRQSFADLQQAQAAFDPWCECYKPQAPARSLGNATRGGALPPQQVLLPRAAARGAIRGGELVRKVQDKGQVCYRGRVLKVSKAFRGQTVDISAPASGKFL